MKKEVKKQLIGSLCGSLLMGAFFIYIFITVVKALL